MGWTSSGCIPLMHPKCSDTYEVFSIIPATCKTSIAMFYSKYAMKSFHACPITPKCVPLWWALVPNWIRPHSSSMLCTLAGGSPIRDARDGKVELRSSILLQLSVWWSFSSIWYDHAFSCSSCQRNSVSNTLMSLLSINMVITLQPFDGCFLM